MQDAVVFIGVGELRGGDGHDIFQTETSRLETETSVLLKISTTAHRACTDCCICYCSPSAQ